jgi:hypothetical protein
MPKRKLTNEQQIELLETLKTRFDENTNRRKGIKWLDVEKKLNSSPDKLFSLYEMERTGGEPDVIRFDKKTGEYVFIDCSEESPKGRRSVCFDQAAHESRKEHKPANSAMGMAAEMGVDILSEDEYRELQKVGEFDLKTSSWIQTPEDIRDRGGALFCDRRYGHVFTYHNGAESYYGARGFRAKLGI